ncbi:MAG: hypothetical protein ABEK16_05415 [Candidatus Nanohalobium sp.]
MPEIPEADGNKLGKLTLDLADSQPRVKVLQYSVNSTGEKETKFDLPRYDAFLGWIEVFGIPPYNEWVLLDEFDGVEKNFSGDINGEKYSESLSIQDRGPAGIQLNLQREMSDLQEEYRVVELDFSPMKTNDSMALFEVDHSEGEYNARLTRQLAQEKGEIEDLREDLTDEELEYLDDVIDEEGEPSIIVLKEAEVDGSTPPVYQKMFPFWNTTNFENSGIRALEIGYMDYGDNETDVDKLHGRWYKLFSFDNFDYDHLEIREGNWKSTIAELDGETIRTKDHYEKHLYNYNP